MPRYSDAFYRNQSDGSRRSARRILPIVFDIVHPKSVVDVGCGVGTWLAEAKSLGVTDLMGYEGAWIKDQQLADASLTVTATDLDNPISIDREYDLAVCLEVGEHLREQRSSSLVNDLCSLSGYVLFSAGTPGQFGEQHINLQWQSFWASKFSSNGYLPYDVVRPLVWGDDDVECWYQQNTLLYSKIPPMGVLPTKMLDLIHPEIFRWQSGRRATVQNLLSIVTGSKPRRKVR
jgi:hypothetical protein